MDFFSFLLFGETPKTDAGEKKENPTAQAQSDTENIKQNSLPSTIPNVQEVSIDAHERAPIIACEDSTVNNSSTNNFINPNIALEQPVRNDYVDGSNPYVIPNNLNINIKSEGSFVIPNIAMQQPIQNEILEKNNAYIATDSQSTFLVDNSFVNPNFSSQKDEYVIEDNAFIVPKAILPPKQAENKIFTSFYSHLINQQSFLQDSNRMEFYNNFIGTNSVDFNDRVILDVGSGIGILSLLSNKYGAKRVYGVESCDISTLAEKLIAANMLQDKIRIIKGSVEKSQLPEMVDTIISAPMGICMLHERMMESFITARKHFLKNGGKLFPTCGNIRLSIFNDTEIYNLMRESSSFWNNNDFYGFNLTCLVEDGLIDTFSQPVLCSLNNSNLLSNDVASYFLDFETINEDDLYIIRIPYSYRISKTSKGIE